MFTANSPLIPPATMSPAGVMAGVEKISCVLFRAQMSTPDVALIATICPTSMPSHPVPTYTTPASETVADENCMRGSPVDELTGMYGK